MVAAYGLTDQNMLMQAIGVVSTVSISDIAAKVSMATVELGLNGVRWWFEVSDFGTVLKAKEASNFIEMLKAVVCNVGNKGLSVAAEFVPVIAQLALEDNNINFWLRAGGTTAGNVGKNILEWSNNSLMESSFCREKSANVPQTNEVISLIRAEAYLKHNNDDYLALEHCKPEDKIWSQFDELGSSWTLCTPLGMSSSGSGDL